MTAILDLPEVPAQALRHADLASTVGVLRARRSQKVDVVVPTNQLSLVGGNLSVAGLGSVQVKDHVIPAVVNADGVTPERVVEGFTYNPSGLYHPNSVVDQHLADLFKIPVRYIRKLRIEDVELLDINVNRHAERSIGSNLVRLLWGRTPGNDVTTGVARAILSDRYQIIDHLDTVLAILAGLDELGLNGSNVKDLDLSESKLYLNVEVPEIAVHGRELIENYRSPFTGQTGAELPMVHAGIKFTNSEDGRGALSATPYALFEVCANGATIDAINGNKVGIRRTHIGKQLNHGEIKWSAETVKAANELVRNQVKDAVGQFLTTDFLQSAVDGWRELAGVKVEKVAETLQVVSDELSWTEDEQADILAKFIDGGDRSAFAVGQAVTASVQGFANADRAHELGEQHLVAAKIAAREAERV